jgi:hypothetical protein
MIEPILEPILEEISEEEYYEHTKEDKYDRNPQYIKEACYDGQGLFYFMSNPKPIGYKYYKVVGYKQILIVDPSTYDDLKDIIER